jgi:adenylate cyclase
VDEGPIVLLVDDDPRVLSALARSLRREPYKIETAENGARALERVASRPEIKLVVSDFKMPGMTGIELLSAVRAQSPNTARILLSGWTSQISALELEAAGLFASHAKPWDDRELKASIRTALGID